MFQNLWSGLARAIDVNAGRSTAENRVGLFGSNTVQDFLIKAHRLTRGTVRPPLPMTVFGNLAIVYDSSTTDMSYQSDKYFNRVMPYWFLLWANDVKHQHQVMEQYQVSDPDTADKAYSFMSLWRYNHPESHYMLGSTSKHLAHMVALDNGLNLHDPFDWRTMQRYMPKTSLYAQLCGYHPKAHAALTALATANIDPNEPKYVSWYEEDLHTYSYRDFKPRRTRWSKFFRRLNSEFGFRFPEAEIDAVSEWVGAAASPPKYHIRISDEGFLRTYREAHFGSCMHLSPAVKFYRKQNVEQGKTVVELMTIHAPDSDELVGRALVWRNVLDPLGNYVTVLDRIYPSDNGSHIDAAIHYAIKHGWVYKTRQSIGGPLSVDGEFRIDVVDVDHYPYMDTFAHTDGPDCPGGTMTLSNCNIYEYSLQNTDDQAPWELGQPCHSCGDYREDDDLVHIEDNDVLVCQSCLADNYTFCDETDSYLPHDRIAHPDNAVDYTVDVESAELYYDDINNASIYVGYIPSRLVTSEYFEVTHGPNAGGYVLEDDAHFVEVDDEVHIYASLASYRQAMHDEIEQQRQAEMNSDTPQVVLFP